MASACQAVPQPAVFTPEPTVVFAPIATGPLAVETTEDLPYTSERSLDVYAPTEGGPWPVVVALHGGSLTKTSLKGLSLAIAERGAVVFTPTWHSSVPSPDAVALGWEDAACAVRYARVNAASYGGNPSRLILVGHSAGGPAGVVTLLGGEAMKGDCLVENVSARADGFVGLDGAYDIPSTTLKAASEKAWAKIDPFAYIGKVTPRADVEFVLFVGLEDELMLNAEKLQSALATAGYRVSLTRLPGKDHMTMASALEETVAAIAELAHGT
jgi:acetyl esterase/lipase